LQKDYLIKMTKILQLKIVTKVSLLGDADDMLSSRVRSRIKYHLSRRNYLSTR